MTQEGATKILAGVSSQADLSLESRNISERKRDVSVGCDSHFCTNDADTNSSFRVDNRQLDTKWLTY